MRAAYVFTQRAATRPLFEEPSCESEREDPCSGPKGFMFGGMSLPTVKELGQQYYEAASLLIEAIGRNKLEDYRLANPVLYLYRHFVELTVKSIVGPDVRGHDLSALAENLKSFLKDQRGIDVPGWITARLKELAAIDPGSTAFRYGENRNKRLNRMEPVDGEIYVSLPHLKQAMTALNAALSSLSSSGKLTPESLMPMPDEDDDWS